MTHDDALELAKRVKRSWRTHQSLDEWTGYLTGFDDPQRASDALDRLREVEPLTFKRFGETYRALAPIEPARDANVAQLPTPRLTRQQRVEILTRNGAPLHIVDAAVWAKEGPL